ncbi:MAG: cytochrome P450, partial [Geminicoccaceae bacterium]
MAIAGYALGEQGFRQPPMPPKRFPLGHLGAFRANPFRFLLHCRAAYGDIVGLQFFRLNAYMVCHPDHIHHVLQKKQAIYDKDFELVDRLRPILGDGMLTAEGAVWQRQRDLAKPAFHGREVQSFGPIITDVIGDVIEDWRTHARDARRLDVHQNMMEVTLRIAGRALFGFDLKAEAPAGSALLNETMEAGLKRVNALIAAPMFLPTPNNRVLKSSRRSLEQVIDRMIDHRRTDGTAGTDLLQRLLDEHDAGDPARRSAQFYDEAITI